MDNKTLIFIEKANKMHNDTYNYDKVKYINAKEKIIINCIVEHEIRAPLSTL